MEQNKSLGLLSLARKGGNIVLGEEQAGAAARASRARLMLLASDAGGHTVRRAKSFVAGTAQPLLTLPYTRDELGDALGTTSCAIAAITDVQLALAFVKTLGEPEKYADLIVRVSGFSAFFTKLAPEVQKDILRRHAHGA